MTGAQVITPTAPQPVLFGPFGMRLPATAAKLLARLGRPGLLWTSALFAAHAAVGAASLALAAQLVSDGGSKTTAGAAVDKPSCPAKCNYGPFRFVPQLAHGQCSPLEL